MSFWIVTPSQARVTCPLSSSSGTSFLARLIGIAKPMPTLPPLWLKMAVVIPTTSPRSLNSGPPELPGLMGASVWMKSSYGPAPIARPLALTMPAVTVLLRPKGLPIATTQSPTLMPSESPSLAVGKLFAGSIFSTARSVFGSRPITLASSSRPSLK